ncbi:transketolase [Mycolicibacterium moriokaense]|jgi:transketolase|uniref:Transketolase, N-terminal subunit n=1 Tax=Mycolicibacterium moriokaense TaxID=39691 RepID=A0AAD1HBI8_9MYCO|nr:transketolase [Mycolicibacterium moriokaense]MCV7041693.1 transketolase [Mycolicibacterium moriokaense]ORB21884.1 transketolase [Mycolicibacterium moriokaense]BBX01521.1 transketolase, N-terminal subunit [Mycolicibacterium moriokaense]
MNNDQTLERYRPVTAAELQRKADWLRLEILRLISFAGLGHYSSSLSAAEVLVTLYGHVLRLRKGDPAWPRRDRFLLGKGHIAVALWPLLAELEYFPEDWLQTFGSLDSRLTDHPDMLRTPGIDFSSGSLGHNLSVGLGMALAARMRGQDHRTFVLTGDGELHEGQIWEAAMAAAHYGVGNLVAIVDANGSCGDGHTEEVMSIEPLSKRFEAFGWRCIEVDGHDAEALLAAFAELPPPSAVTPTCVIARTRKGKGLAFMEKAPRDWHLGNLGPLDLEAARAEIGARIR